MSRRVARGDAGISMVEVMVTMVLMSVVMVVFTTAVIQIYRVSGRTQTTSTAQAQLNIAFLRLDEEIRYASGVSTQGTVNGDPYIEYLLSNTGTPMCTELRLHVVNGQSQLQRRTWVQNTTPGSFVMLATSVVGTAPFTFHPADATNNYQRLELNFTASASTGAGTTATTRQTDVTFTALNTSLSTISTTVCSEGRTTP